MNTTQLKTYAPAARRAFIAAVSAQAARLGISANDIEPTQVQGDVLLIGGQAFPHSIGPGRRRLVERIRAHGFEATMEASAYTWFNRFVAIRYMELHGYLAHGYRVLSAGEAGARPEILDHAADVELPGLNRNKAIELKLDGTQDEALYRLLLLAQCNALHQAMPFLFERIGDETELLLPANLLHTDSLIRQLVEGIDEAAWQEIEIIGWLYQFYISEKKDEVIGKVVASADIPAATQLFTPNWIVKYMVQNSLGAQWLATYPHSPLKGQMAYYIEPAEQTDEVKAQLAAITPSQLNPEVLTLIDPASGSGHILVEAYELFKAIYLERGYRQRDVPQLILEQNLFGLDIDERAAQLTGFALMMKGRADDRRLFERGVKLNVMALVDSAGLEADEIIRGLGTEGRLELVPSDDMFPDTLLQPPLAVTPKRDVDVEAIRSLIALFEHATTFGSLIQVPEGLVKKLPALKQLGETTSQDLFVSDALNRLGLLVQQAMLLASQYDAVVANPPYMGSGVMNALVKKFTKDNFPDAKSDLFACFIKRGGSLARRAGRSSMVTMDGWMFLSSYSQLRESLMEQYSIDSLVHVGWNCFPEVHTYHRGVAFVLINGTENERGHYLNLSDVPATVDKGYLFLSRASDGEQLYCRARDDFSKIPTSPLAYWVSEAVRGSFARLPRAATLVSPREGLATGNNEKYVRSWFEVSQASIGSNCESRTQAEESCRRWFPYNKGGDFRKWSGNNLFVVDWLNDGFELQNTLHPSGSRVWAHNFNLEFIFRPFVTWSDVTSKGLTLRVFPSGYLFDATGLSAFSIQEGDSRTLLLMAALGNSVLGARFSQVLNPTLHFKSGNFADLPVESSVDIADAEHCISLARTDWNAYERSWDFQSLPLLTGSSDPTPTLESSYTAWITQNRATIAEMKRLEEENNRLFIDAYGLADELTPDVPIEQITLTVNPAYRYGGKLTAEAQWTRFRQDSMEELVSYAIGCMMGRYSLDAPGLIYAHSGNDGFDPSRYPTFPADDDGIVPLTDTEWFDDDAAHRLIEFISLAWDESQLEANLTFLADNLSPKKTESSRETIRRYLNDKFFKAHLKSYKKRPIYWLFSSGKQKAFQGLVYLHRYNAGTLSRMRSEYVIPLQGKMAARLDQLQGDIDAATSTAQRKRLERERAKLGKQQVELITFDEKLRHYADMRISLDLDDGVKVNYGKFGNLLAEVKAVHGQKAEGA